MNEKEIIEKLKKNWTALGGLSEDEKAVLKKYKRYVGVINEYGELIGVGFDDIDNLGLVYRVADGFNLPEPKWWFDPELKCVIQAEVRGNAKTWLVVSEGFAKYLSTPHDGFELRMAKKGDEYIELEEGRLDVSNEDFIYLGPDDTGHRWCKSKPKEGWFVADVDGDGYYTNQHGDIIWVYKPRIRNFCGVQFHGQADETWYTNKEMLIDDNGNLFSCDDIYWKKRPARISKVRIWMGGEK